jgi:hypothetical protein
VFKSELKSFFTRKSARDGDSSCKTKGTGQIVK